MILGARVRHCIHSSCVIVNRVVTATCSSDGTSVLGHEKCIIIEIVYGIVPGKVEFPSLHLNVNKNSFRGILL